MYINAVRCVSYQDILQIHRGMPGFGQMTELEKKRVTVSEGYSSCDSADDMDRHVADDKRRPRAKVGYC